MIRHSRITRFLREGMFADVPVFMTQAYISAERCVKHESTGGLRRSQAASLHHAALVACEVNDDIARDDMGNLTALTVT